MGRIEPPQSPKQESALIRHQAPARRWFATPFGLRNRLLAAIGGVTLVGVLLLELTSMLGIPPLGLEGSLQKFRSLALRALDDSANLKRNELQTWLKERREDLLALSENELLAQLAMPLAQEINQAAAQGTVSPAFWDRYRQHPQLAALTRQLQMLRDTHPDTYAAISLHDAKSGLIIASSRGVSAIGASPLLGDPQFEQSRSPGQIEVIDLFGSPLDGDNGKPYLRITRQQFSRDEDGGKVELVGVATALIRPENIPLTQGVRSGRTSEVILVNHDQRIMTPLRFPLPDGAPAVVNVYKLEDKVARLATDGGEGLTTDIDYRGIKVLTAYRHVRISPELGWGIIVKQDEAEALEPLYDEVKRHVALALLSLLALLGIVVLVARRLAAPISALARTAQALESGDLAARSGITSGDEIGQLGRTLDAMARQTQHWHETLSEEVRRRTRQLIRANQLYRILSETNQAIVHLTDRQALFSMVCDVVVEHGQFQAAWITTNFGGVINLENFHGPNEFLNEGENCLLDGPCGSAGLCMATAEPVIITDAANDERMAGCRPALGRTGWQALASFPLLCEKEIFGAFTVASAEPEVFDAQAVELLGEMAGDIGYAVQILQREARRVAAEESLRVHEDQLRAITDSALDAVVSIDSRGTVEFWNPAAEKLFGYNESEAMGRPLHDLIAPPERREEAGRGFARFLVDGRGPIVGRTIEATALRKDGSSVVVELAISPVRRGDRWHAVGIARDISVRKTTEEALRMVAEELSVQSGADFFQGAAQGLARLLDAAYVLIGQLNPEDQSVASVGLVTPEGVADNFAYALAGTPCSNVTDGSICVYRSGVAQLFPEDTMLVEMGARAYAGVPLFDAEGAPIGIIAVLWRRELGETENPDTLIRIFAARASAELSKFKVQTRLQASEKERRMLAFAVEQSPANVMITDPDGIIEYVNNKFTETTGYTAENSIGRTPGFLKSGQMPPETYRNLWEAVGRGDIWRGELCNRKHNGELYWIAASIAPVRDENGVVSHLVELAEDITLRKQYEAQLIRQAHYDDLTGLPNRLLAMDRLMGALSRAERERNKVAVMFVDLDNFKQINDSLGHTVGDALLKQVAARLKGCVRESDSISRLGGDEFLVMLSGIDNSADAERVASNVVSSFREHFIVENHEVYSTVSIGITISPEDGDTTGVLMRNADAAMYRTKAEGRNAYRFFSAEIASRSERRLEVETRLRHAIERGELYPVFQPIIDLQSGHAVGAEILLRWHSPELDPIYPDEFIAVAEDTGMIVPIGEYVLQLACQEAAGWQSISERPLRIAVNVSSRQLRTGDFIALVERILSRSGLPPALLEIEITERAVVENMASTVVILNRLRAAGVRVSMDDFGTGSSSLSYLNALPIDTLKIDKSFVQDVMLDRHDANLTESIIAIGHKLDLKVLAEGVENKDQLDFLRQRGCHMAQGYYFSKPIRADAFRLFLHEYRPDIGDH